MAITEHGTMNSIPDAYFSSKDNGIKYIVGCELYYCDYESKRRAIVEGGAKLGDLKQDDDLWGRMRRNRHLTVLCKNMTGYRNLLAINKASHEKQFYGRPRTSLDLLAKHREGLIVLSGCMNGPMSYEVLHDNLNGFDKDTAFGKIHFIGALEYLKALEKLFGDDFYMELQMPGVEGDVELFESLADLSEEYKIKPVITGDCHYLSREDFMTQKVMMAIDQNLLVDDPNLFHVNSDEQYLKSREDLLETFKNNDYSRRISTALFERACDNTMDVASKCSEFEPDFSPKLPRFDDANNTLRTECVKNLKKRGLDKDEKKYLVDGRMVTHTEQMEIELERLIDKEYASYFLITRDLIQASLKKGWILGPGRGSCAGSLVCYLLDITTINPLLWGGLSFNRFLSPARGGKMLKVDMPDE